MIIINNVVYEIARYFVRRSNLAVWSKRANLERRCLTHSYAPYASNLISLDENPPKRTKVVICGGGLVGISIAYHLSLKGWGEDTLLLEQGRLGGTVSWRASGFLGGVRLSKAEMNILRHALNLVKLLDAKGHDLGWKQSGSLHLARSKPRIIHFKRIEAIAKARGTECYMLSPSEIGEKYPYLNVDDLCGGFWVPNDGVCDPYKLTMTLLQESKKNGVQFIEGCTLERTVAHGDKVVAVETSRGIIECDLFVNAAGTWARKVGQSIEPFVKVPVHPAEHYTLLTNPVDLPDFDLPAIRDPDGHIYIRNYNGAVLCGSFDEVSKPAFEKGDFPTLWHEKEREPDYDHFHFSLEQLLHRIPALRAASLNQLHNTADAFSPDSKWIFGQSPEFLNYFIAAGIKSGGSNAAVGIGRILSEWIVRDHSPLDAYELDVLRFLSPHSNRKFLRDRVREVPGLSYRLSYPFADFNTGRCIRMSPIFPRLKADGAAFGQVMGYERPCYFISDLSHDEMEYEGSHRTPFISTQYETFMKPFWINYTEKEYTACRETCGLLDYSSFAKFDIYSNGDEVVDYLQYLCSNNVDIPVGSIVHSGMQNKDGGYENDCSLARISKNHYMMVAPSIQQTRCLTWMKRHLPQDRSVIISDVTSMYTAICIMGPNSRKILSEVTDTDLSPKSFPFFSFREIDIGLAYGIRAMNLTHTGELGWVLYIPNEFALHVHDQLWSVGQKHGICHAGYFAMRSLRVERFYAFWGQDLDSTTTPLECGRVFRTKLDTSIPFLGREALERQQKEGVNRLYCHLTLNDFDPELDIWPCGGEPIYRNGEFVGVTTTTGYGFTLQRLVCLGFIRNVNDKGEHCLVTSQYVMEGNYEVDIAGIRHPATASLRSPNIPSKSPDLNKGTTYQATQLNGH